MAAIMTPLGPPDPGLTDNACLGSARKAADGQALSRNGEYNDAVGECHPAGWPRKQPALPPDVALSSPTNPSPACLPFQADGAERREEGER
jgi:hypothetical protein